MRSILLAAALAGAAWTAHAEPTTWQFTYTGFLAVFDETTLDGSTHREEFRPDIEITGSFTGADGNGDGVIALSELSGFTLRGTDYFACMAEPSPYSRCAIDSFSYALTGALDFTTRTSGNDEYYTSWDGSVVSGQRAQDGAYRHSPWGADRRDSVQTLYWTDATRFGIAPAPVPEPASGMLAAAGLILLAGLRRRACAPLSAGRRR